MEKITIDGIEYSQVKIREDLIEDELSVPVGKGYYSKPDPLPCRWVNEGEQDEAFEVYLNGKWQEAMSIDFDWD